MQPYRIKAPMLEMKCKLSPFTFNYHIFKTSAKKISFKFLILFLSLRARVTSKISLQSDFSCWNCLHRSFLFIMTTLVISDNLPLLYFLNFDRNESIYHLQDLFWLLLLVSSRLFTKSENKDKASLIVFHLHWHSAKFQWPP